MKDIEKMTLKEAVDELAVLLRDYQPDDDVLEGKVTEVCARISDDAEINVYLKNFIAVIEILTYDDEKEYEIITNAFSGDFFDAWLSFDGKYPAGMKACISSANLSAIKTGCVTMSLDKIKKELSDEILKNVFNGHRIVSFEYLLANPRKDVVEWALAHKDELGLRNVNPDFIKEYQAIPELRDLILKTLKT